MKFKLKRNNWVTATALTIGATTSLPAIAGIVLSGSGNNAPGSGAVIAGGNQNTASDTIAAIIAGAKNTCSKQGAAIISGFENVNAGFDSVIASGNSNEVVDGALRCVILSGLNNEISAAAATSFIGAGGNNVNAGDRTGIVVGENNTITQANASSGGRNSAILCGDGNTISGEDSAILAGLDNLISADADYSVVGGQNATCDDDGCFVWNSTGTPFGSTSGGQFLINVSDGVGIGVNNPSADLHVAGEVFVAGETATALRVSGSQVGDNNTIAGHSVHLRHDVAGGSSSVLAVQVGDSSGASDNYITFFDEAGSPAGNIASTFGGGGVTYGTSGADFAEYLQKAPGVDYEVAEIVPVSGGRVLERGQPAEGYMIVSGQAAFCGNSPLDDSVKENDYELLSFIGQVPVNVRGEVTSGDFIVASETSDGTGFAKSAADITAKEMSRVVGRAWESSSDTGLKQVNTVVGLDQTSLIVPTIQRMEDEARQKDTRISELEARLARMEALLTEAK